MGVYKIDTVYAFAQMLSSHRVLMLQPPHTCDAFKCWPHVRHTCGQGAPPASSRLRPPCANHGAVYISIVHDNVLGSMHASHPIGMNAPVLPYNHPPLPALGFLKTHPTQPTMQQPSTAESALRYHHKPEFPQDIMSPCTLAGGDCTCEHRAHPQIEISIGSAEGHHSVCITPVLQCASPQSNSDKN